MAVRVPWADSSSIFPVSPSRDFHRSARCTQSTRGRAVLAPIEDVMKLIGISSYPRRKGDAMKKLALALTLACLLGPASTHAQNAYITNANDNTVSVIDTATDTVIATIPVGLNPFGVAVSSDRRKAYVTPFRSYTPSVIDTATNTTHTTIPL